jgi:hypothetical protein
MAPDKFSLHARCEAILEKPNVGAEYLGFWLRVLEVSDSSLGLYIDYPEVFPSPSSQLLG